MPVSEKPKHPDLYHTLVENESLGIEGLPCHNNYIGDPNGGYWEIDGESKVTHYLQPIPIPDAERLRDALGKIYNKPGMMIKDIQEIAREALSQTRDGWIEIKEGCEMPDYDELVLWHPIDANQFTAMLDKDGNDWLAYCTHWKRLGNSPNIDMGSPEMIAKEKAYLEYLSKAF